MIHGWHFETATCNQLVCQRTLESTNQRQFGFFYYSDQSELLVRNVQWTGKWPRELMAVSDQELSIEVAEFLDQKSEHLTAVFEHDFVRDGMNEDRITPVHGGGPETLRITPEGLVAIRPGSDGYRNTTIAPNLQMQGDFDITVAYDNFESAPTTKGSSSLMLVALLDNPTADEFFVTRRHMFYAEGNEQQIVQCATVQKPPEGETRDYFVTKVMEDRSGRLRLSRRGTVVYDFTKEPPDASILYRWVDLREWNEDHKGLRIEAEGFDSWESAGVCTLNPISGDFDITAEFEIVGYTDLPSTPASSYRWRESEIGDPVEENRNPRQRIHASDSGSSYSPTTEGCRGVAV